MADKPVVVMKFRPMNPGNRLEGKTEMTVSGGLTEPVQPKVV